MRPVFPALCRVAHQCLLAARQPVAIHGLIQALGLATGSRAWFERVLDGRFWVSDQEVGLWSWQRPFPPVGETIVALDLEATNGDPAKEEIIEIGAVKLWPDGRRESFSRFNAPKRPISPYVQELTGITPQMLRGAPPLEQSLLELLDFLEGATLVIQNAEFDLAFLLPLFGKLGRKLENPVVDTLNLARRALPGKRKRGLDALGLTYQVALRNRHRALGDAEATLEVAQALYFALSSGKPITLAQLHQESLRSSGRVQQASQPVNLSPASLVAQQKRKQHAKWRRQNQFPKVPS